MPIPVGREQKDHGKEFKGYCFKIGDFQYISQIRTYLVSNKPDATKHLMLYTHIGLMGQYRRS